MEESCHRNIVSLNLYKDKIIKAVGNNQVVIINGEGGSDKSTKIAQFLTEAGLERELAIAVTEPGQTYDVSGAKMIANGMIHGNGSNIGSGTLAKINYMTDWTFINECVKDRYLKKYGVIIIGGGEARSLDTDISLGIINEAIMKRKDLKVIITCDSAIKQRFSSYFNNAPILSIRCSFYKVSLIYEEISENSYIKHTVKLVDRIRKGSVAGDILIFVASLKDVDVCCNRLNIIDDIVVLPLLLSMNFDLEQDSFLSIEKKTQRKVIVTAALIESAIIIDDIKFVIDCGIVKRNHYDVTLDVDVLLESIISKGQADKRRNIAGLTGKGFCYRLYKKSQYDKFLDEVVPDIKFKDLSGTYLKIVAAGYNPMDFNFLDNSSKETLKGCRRRLKDLELLDSTNSLTDMGQIINDLPVDPAIGKALLSSINFNCLCDVTIIMAMMMSKNMITPCKQKNSQIELCHRKFFDENGDQFTALNVFNEFVRNDKSKEWCSTNFFDYYTLMHIDIVRTQLHGIMEKHRPSTISSLLTETNVNRIKCAIIKGYFKNICVRQSPGTYIRKFNKEVVFIHPSSCLFKANHNLILYHKILVTQKSYMHGLISIDDGLLEHFIDEMRIVNYGPGNITKLIKETKKATKAERSSDVFQDLLLELIRMCGDIDNDAATMCDLYLSGEIEYDNDDYDNDDYDNYDDC